MPSRLTSILARLVILAVAGLLLVPATSVSAVGSGYFYSEGGGWTSVGPSLGEDFTFGTGRVAGHGWSDLTGWVYFGEAGSVAAPDLQSPSSFGVIATASGANYDLSGFAWGEQSGWMRMDHGISGYRARILGGTSPLTFTGYAWSENLGWVALGGLVVSGTNHSATVTLTQAPPDTTAPSAVSALSVQTGATAGNVVLSWTAVGDDAGVGTATSYDVRWSTSAISNDAAFTAATQLSGEPTPSAAGSPQSWTVSGFGTPGTYYFAVKVTDDAGNVSALSNSPSVTVPVPPDTTTPAQISTLAAGTGGAQGTINLSWTAVGDDGNSGTATSYDVRWSSSSIGNDAAFTTATQVTGEPTPGAAGSAQSMSLTGMASGTYFFAVKAVDESGNASPLSNSPSTAVPVPPDTTAPSAPTLTVSSGSGQITVSWTAVGDDGATGTATSYDLRYATSAISNLTAFGTATQVAGEPTPSASGSPQSMTITGLAAGTTYFASLRVTDDAGNVSTLSNSPSATTTTPSVPGSSVWVQTGDEISFTGQVAIGSTPAPTGYAFVVDGKILAEELTVQMSEAWPDYVFQNFYPMKSLGEVEAFVKKEKHLPGVPSERELGSTIGLGEMVRVLMEKVEEVFLYLFQHESRIDALEARLTALEAQLDQTSR